MHRTFMTRLLELLVSLFFLLHVAGCSATGTQQAPPPIELRGVWLADEEVFAGREKIADALQFVADHNFNAVFPVVWNGGQTLYPSKVLEQWLGTSAATAHRDILAELIEEAHKRGLAVVPTVTLSLAPNRPFSKALANTKPQWLARDRAGNPVSKDGLEWLNPLHPEAQEFLFGLVSEIAKNYDVDGILGGDRLLAEPIEAGYDSVTLERYRETHAGNNPPSDVHEIHWKHWRAVQINSVAQRMYWRAKAFKSRFVMGWAPLPYREALSEYLQDWRSWITENPYGEYYADFIVPLIAAPDTATYRRTLDAQHKDTLRIKQKNRYLFPGVVLHKGDRVATESELLEALRYNRLNGYNGEVIFSLEALRADNNRLASALKRTYYSRQARLPFDVPAAAKQR